MSIQVPRPMFVDGFSSFAPCCHSVIVDNSCLSTVGNDGSYSSVGEITILSERGDAFVTESSNLPMVDSVSSGDTSVT